MRWLSILLRLTIGGVFIWAGALKALDPAGFAQSVEGYQLLPYAATVTVALYLPWLEIICGAVLIMGWLRHGARGLLSIMLLVFIVALITAWWRGLDVDCGCFGQTVVTGEYLWPIARNVALLAGLIVLMLTNGTFPKSIPTKSA